MFSGYHAETTEIWPNGPILPPPPLSKGTVETLNRDSHCLYLLSGATTHTVSIYYLVKPLPRSISTTWWNHSRGLYLLSNTVSVYYLVKPLPRSISTTWWNHRHGLYLLPGETTHTVSIYYLVKPLPLSLSTIWWNHSHCLFLLSGETTPTVYFYYLVKPLTRSQSTTWWNHSHGLYLLSGETIWWNHSHCLYLLSGETTPTVYFYYLVKPLPLSISTIWWNHSHGRNLPHGETTHTVSICYLVKPLPRSLSATWWNHSHSLYLLSNTVSVYYLVKPQTRSLSTTWWNHFHCLYLLSGETTPTVSIYYLVKPLPLSLSTICETTPTVSIYYLVKPQTREPIAREGAGFKLSKFIHKCKQHHINIQKLYRTILWHGARTCKVSRKYSNASSRYSAKTKRDGQTDRRTDGGRFNMQCILSRASARREIITWHFGCSFATFISLITAFLVRNIGFVFMWSVTVVIFFSDMNFRQPGL